MKKAILIELLTVLLVILFFYTGVAKLVDFKGFSKGINKQHLPFLLGTGLIYTLPWAEIATAILLLFQRTRMKGLCLSLGLLTAFTSYIAAVLLHFFAKIPCPCGGAISYFSWQQHLLFNLFFLAINIIAIILEKRSPRQPTESAFITAGRSNDISRAK